MKMWLFFRSIVKGLSPGLGAGIGLLIAGLLACHPVVRNNPFDPALTQPVDLLAATLDTTTGIITLTWTPYEGDQPFAAYRVLRKVKGIERVDTLMTMTDLHQTTFQDTTLKPDLEYLYWVAVVNEARLAMPSDTVGVTSFTVVWEPRLEVQADHLAGTIAVHWKRYGGPDFERYDDMWVLVQGVTLNPFTPETQEKKRS